MRYRNYYNWESGRRKIYSDEDIMRMTIKEALEHELELAYQHKTIGIPSEEELLNSSYGKQYRQDHGMDAFEQLENFNKSNDELPMIGDEYSKVEDEISEDNQHSEINPIEQIQNMYGYLTGRRNEIQKESLMPKQDVQLAAMEKQPKIVNGFKSNTLAEMPEEENKILKGRVEKTNWPLLDKMKDAVKKYEDLDQPATLQKATSKLPINFIEREYYGLQSHLNDGEKIPKRILKENNIFRYGDIKDRSNAQKYTKELAKMYGFAPNDKNIEELLRNKVIVEPKENSRISKYIKNSDAMQQWIADNYERLKSGDIRKGESVEFPLGGDVLNKEKRGLNLTINKASIDNIKFNEDGSMTYELRDPDDYEYQKKTGDYNDIVKYMNNNAYKQQEAGQLENFLFSIKQNLTKEELEQILKKRKRK